MSSAGYTRAVILDRACELASRVGLSGLTMGSLARCLRRPRSTVSSLFRTKIDLQLHVLEYAARDFLREVVRPAVAEPGPLARLERLVERWLAWDRTYPGGCLFVATASEFDDRPGPVHDRLVQLHRAWLGLLRGLVRSAVRAGTLRPDLDPDQLLQELHGALLAYHLSARLLHDPAAERRAGRVVAELVGRVRRCA